MRTPLLLQLALEVEFNPRPKTVTNALVKLHIWRHQGVLYLLKGCLCTKVIDEARLIDIDLSVYTSCNPGQ